MNQHRPLSDASEEAFGSLLNFYPLSFPSIIDIVWGFFLPPPVQLHPPLPKLPNKVEAEV